MFIMASLFDLKTNVSDLAAANAGISRNNYEQFAPLREVNGDTFGNGQITFRFETTGTKWWIPSKTYIRARCTLAKSMNGDTPVPLTIADGIAPNINLMNNLFQSAELQINNRTVSKISNFMPQISTLETRLTKTKQYKHNVAKYLNTFTPSFAERQQMVCSDGKSTENDIEWIKHTALNFVPTTTISFATSGTTGKTTVTLVTTNTNANFSSTFQVGDYIRLVDASTSTVLAVMEATVERVVDTELVCTTTTPMGVAAASTSFAMTGTDKYFMRGRKHNFAKEASKFELIWTPPLSIFKVPHAIPPGARVDIILNPQPQSTYKMYAIETLPPYKAPSNSFVFTVDTMFLYVNTIEGARVENLTYLLDLESTVMFKDTITSNSFTQKNFDVPTSTYALTLAYQNRDAMQSDNTHMSQCKFHVGYSDIEKYINRFYISYAGQQLPQPDADPAYDQQKSKQWLTQRWIESLQYSNGQMDPFIMESEDEWLQYGPYFHFAWPRDAADRSTRVQVFNQFDDTTAKNDIVQNGSLLIPADSGQSVSSFADYATKMSSMAAMGDVLLFSHYREVARVTIQDSRVVNVELEIA